MAAILYDVTDRQQRNNSKYLPHLVDHVTGFLLKVKYFPNIVTPQKPRGGVATTRLVPRWGSKFACTIQYNTIPFILRARVKTFSNKFQKNWVNWKQEKIIGQRGILPVIALEYLNCKKAIFSNYADHFETFSAELVDSRKTRFHESRVKAKRSEKN